MKRIILVASFAFAGMSTYLNAGGFGVNAGVLFGGQTKVNLSGAESATGATTDTEKKVDNEAGFMIGAGYMHDFSDKFLGMIGIGYSSQKTSGKLNFATKAGTTWVAADNNTATTSAFDLKLGVQFAVVKDFNIGVALTYPLWAEIKGDGSFDNRTGADTYKLDGSLGIDFNLAYMFTKNFSANLGYSFLNTSDSNNNGTNGVALSISSSVSRFVFGVGYNF